MIGFYNYTVILTYISLLISTVGIFIAPFNAPLALLCLILSGVCDMFDGKIARTRKTSTDEEKRFGIQLDSLCDIVCFGVLPAIIGACHFPLNRTLTAQSTVVAVLAALYVLCGLIRLAFFNVTEETRQSTETGRRTHYLGVPVTTAAMVFPLCYVVSRYLLRLNGIFASLSFWVYPAFLLITAVAFILPVKVKKPHGAGMIVMGVIGLAELILLIPFLA
jgi:CDP-diacylglycerol--serine O-phosphatidyltransferase